MSEAEKYDSVRVSAEGIRVVKRFAADEFPVPAIAFEISSERDEAVTVKLSDPVPDGVDVEDLGFHPDYGSEHWTIDEHQITFERELDPDVSYTTVYGIRAVDDIEQFLTEPTLEEVDPPLPGTDQGGKLILEGDDALLEDEFATNTTFEASDETTEEADVPSTLDLGEPSNGTEPDDTSAGAAGGAADDSTTATAAAGGMTTDESRAAGGVSVGEGSLVAALATELRENDIPQEDIEQLREVLAEEDGRPDTGSTVARLDQLQADIAEIRAYTGALEEFLDENGTGEQLIESFEEELASFDERVEHLETEFVVEVRERIEELEATLETLEADVTAKLDRLDDLESEVDRLDDLESEVDRLDDLESEVARLDDLESDIEHLQQWKEQLIKTLGG